MFTEKWSAMFRINHIISTTRQQDLYDWREAEMTSKTRNTTRREFLKTSGLIAGTVIFSGFSADGKTPSHRRDRFYRL
jgi:hypothetical protein